MSERETWMSEEAAFDWIEDRLRKNGGIAATVANASLYLDCGRAADAYSDIAELVEPIVRSAVEKAVAEREREHKRDNERALLVGFFKAFREIGLHALSRGDDVSNQLAALDKGRS